MAVKSSKNKKGNKKHGRNRKWCEMYRASGQREKNKALKQARHERRYGKGGSIGGENKPPLPPSHPTNSTRKGAVFYDRSTNRKNVGG